MSATPAHAVGLALSGGGSRAAAFHRGTLQALIELELVNRVDVVSTVSGGSLFGAAWLVALAAGKTHEAFLAKMREELTRGFIWRSFRPFDVARSLIPGIAYSRTNVIADTFDRIFFHGSTLCCLPERPALCINTALLDNGQVGKFSREGFSAYGLRVLGSTPEHLVRWGGFPLCKAVAASAAFPIGLPPLTVKSNEFPPGVTFEGKLRGATSLTLTDGGVVENLGIQTLLASDRFAAWDLVVSDAGPYEDRWSSRPVLGALKGAGVWIASGRVLDRLMLVMNDKQNRWARQHVMHALELSQLAETIRSGAPPLPGMAHYLASLPARPSRKLLFVRVAQNWSSFLASVPHHRLVELAVAAGLDPVAATRSGRTTDRAAFLAAAGVDLRRAESHYAELGGDDGAAEMSNVKTNFTALAPAVVDRLAHHAAWQTHASAAIYGF